MNKLDSKYDCFCRVKDLFGFVQFNFIEGFAVHAKRQKNRVPDGRNYTNMFQIKQIRFEKLLASLRELKVCVNL